MNRRHFLAAQAWYAISQGAPAFLNPFLNLFFTQLGITPAQIGLLSALRPWISAPSGSLIAGVADRWGAHRPLLIVCYLAMTWVQGLMALPVFASFTAVLVLTILSSLVYTPASILADAAVMAASTHPGDYGRLRTWASVSWTAFAPLAGWVNNTFGIRAGIACYVVGSMLALPAAWMLPVEALRSKVAPVIGRVLSKGAEEVPLPAPLADGQAELRQPLLAEEAPTPVTQRAGLTKALAIVRYIEVLTELGVAPPPGVGLYGFAALPLNYVAQHLAPIQDDEPEAAASPGYSPFAGAAEPGSESPGFGAATAGASTASSVSTPSSPAGLSSGAAGRVQQEGGEARWGRHERPGEERTVHGSSDALGSLGRQPMQPPPQRRPATLPRPISADELGRVASLAHGIPRVRTRPGALAVPAPPRPGAAQQGAATAGAEVEEESSPEHDFVVLRRRAAGRAADTSSDEEEEGREEEEEAAVFAADDLHAGEHALLARQQLRRLDTAPSASALLRDVRGIGRQAEAAAGPAGEPESVQGRAAEGGKQLAAASGAGRVGSGAEELPVSFSPPQEASTPSATPSSQRAQRAAASPAGVAETPMFRSAALARLAQIFGGLRAQGGQGSFTGGPVAAVEAGEAGDEEVGSVPPASAALSPTGFTPVRKYLEHRQDKLERKQQRRQQREAAAAAEGREPEPPTPVPPSSAFAGLFGLTPTLAAAAQLPQAQQTVPPELMREALDLELREVEQDHDATGSMVVGMLTKKLERMAREAKRQQRLKLRAERQKAKQAAAAAAAAAARGAGEPAAPEAAEEGAAPGPLPRLQRLGTMAEEREAAAVAAAAVPAEQLGFVAALRRLLSDPQVVTFFVLTTILGFGHGIIGGFLFMHLAELGGSAMLMGAVLTANALPELPAFFYFGQILSAMGMQTVLFTAAGALGVRIWAYSMLPRIGLNWIVPIEALHAVTYACGWSASAVNSSKIAPPGLEGTTQGIFQGLWTGVGCGVAGIVGGLLYGSHGAEFLFKVSGLAILASTAAAMVPALVLRWRRKRRREPLPSKESLDDLAALAH